MPTPSVNSGAKVKGTPARGSPALVKYASKSPLISKRQLCKGAQLVMPGPTAALGFTSWNGVTSDADPGFSATVEKPCGNCPADPFWALLEVDPPLVQRPWEANSNALCGVCQYVNTTYCVLAVIVAASTLGMGTFISCENRLLQSCEKTLLKGFCFVSERGSWASFPQEQPSVGF